MVRIVSLGVLLALIVILGTTFFRVVAPFLLPLFIAGITAVICQPLFRYFLKRTGQRVPLAAGATTFTIMASLLIPIITATVLASLQLYTFAATMQSSDELRLKTRGAYHQAISFVARTVEKVQALLPQDHDHPVSQPVEQPPPVRSPQNPIPDEPFSSGRPEDVELADLPPSADEAPAVQMERDLPPAEEPGPTPLEPVIVDLEAQLRGRVREMLRDLGDRSLGQTAGTTIGVLAGTVGLVVRAVIGLVMCAIALYFFLADGSMLLQAAETMIPVHAKYQRELFSQFAKVVRAVVLATFLAALGQGLATTLALWFFGFDHLLLLFVLACLGALIPLAGTWLVWMPCAVILFFGGHPWQAACLVLYGMFFVGFLDNIIRTYVLNSDTKLHPLLAFVSVLGGIQAMGLWGVFIGPIVASCLHALIKIFNHELMEFSRDRSQRVLAVEGAAETPSASVILPGVSPPPKPSPAGNSKSRRKKRR